MRCVAAGLLLAAGAQAASISGTAYRKQPESRRPLAGVQVIVREPGGPVLGTTATDAQGRYRFEDLPRSRVQVTAARPGYFVRALRSGEPALLVDLSSGEELRGLDFEFQPGGAITGRLTNARGDPLEGADVRVHRVSDFGGRHQHPPATFRADDRGIYRAFGLEPGRYLLEIAPPEEMPIQPDRPAPVYYPGVADPSQAAEIDVAAGAEINGLDLIFQNTGALVRFSGRVADLPGDDLHSVLLELWSPGILRTFTVSSPDGTFGFGRVPPGRYFLTATSPGGGILTRQPIELSSDVSDFLLRPGKPGQLTGRIRLSNQGPKPPGIRLRVVPRGSLLRPQEAVAPAPDYRFQFEDIWPGPHTLEIAAPPKAYLASGADSLDVPPGGMSGLELTAGFGLATVTGIVKAPGSGPLPHARLAVARPGTSPVWFRDAVSDQNGRFVLSDLTPGEYLVRAWSRIERERLYGPEAWGTGVKRIIAEPGAQIELELTADP